MPSNLYWICKSMSAYVWERSPHQPWWEENLNPILEALGQPLIDADPVTSAGYDYSKECFRIGTSKWVPHDIYDNHEIVNRYIPLSVLNAAEPLEAAKEWRKHQLENEA